jgi:signal transduction histidine kinase
MVNALDAMPSGGDITFSSQIQRALENEKQADQIRIEIHDTGVGISEANLPYVFDPFYSTKESGTGLGLPLSLGIVESHHGRMTLVSRPEEGTTVVIDLPLKMEPLIGEACR